MTTTSQRFSYMIKENSQKYSYIPTYVNKLKSTVEMHRENRHGMSSYDITQGVARLQKEYLNNNKTNT